MIKADKYFKELLQDIQQNGVWSKKPRTVWEDGTPAQYKSVYNKEYIYDISANEFPAITLRNTPFRGCFEEMRWFYQLQSNVIEDAHPSIHDWWTGFVVNNGEPRPNIGKTYGYVVKKYDLINKLLHGLEHNPESRRHIINLWDNQSQQEDPQALPPCAYMTKWTITVKEQTKYLNCTLYQRSRDTLLTFSINPIEYVMLQMMIAGHLTHSTKVPHKPGLFIHKVDDEHIYDRNEWAVQELLQRPSTNKPIIIKTLEPKNFYDYTYKDFEITSKEKTKPLSKKLKVAL